jgi:uncharacterized protein (TIGR02231 family)
MRTSPLLSSGLAGLLGSVAVAVPAAVGQDLAAREHRADSAITAVTVYADRAGVTRTASSPAEAGVWDVRLGGLPAAIDPESLQAKVAGGKLLDVRYEERTIATDAATDPELRAAIARLEELRRARQEREFAAKVLEGEGKLLDAITARIADAAAKEAGGAIEPARLGEQMDFLTARRKQLAGSTLDLVRQVQKLEDEIRAAEAEVKRRGGESRVERDAIVTVATAGGAAGIELSYLVLDAGWRPGYAVRADPDAKSLVIEFDAVIAQVSGEDWDGVRLSVSTAEPSRRPLPPGIPPVFVEPLPPAVEGGTGGGGFVASRKAGMPPPSDAAPGSPGGAFGSPGEASEELRRVMKDAEAITSGAVVSYTIPRPVSIPSDDSAERKTRVATIEAKPTFSLVTRPIVDPAVYAKAVAVNDSPYLLLGGAASVFVGGDSVGTARLADVPPGGEMVFWLGADRRVEAKRSLVARNAERSGVFTKDDVTTWKWKIELVNTGASAVEVVVDDRVPVSRDERIKVELKDLSRPLSTDARYLADERPQGTLRWTVPLPARTSDAAPAPVALTWTTVLKRPLDLAITPVPD